jgi:hypothetical protein
LKSLDGWEAEDDPVKEHVAYSSSCGIAVIAQLEQELEAGSQNIQNPTSEEMNEARKATFGDMWPHEGKRGWVCKTQKVRSADKVIHAYLTRLVDGRGWLVLLPNCG